MSATSLPMPATPARPKRWLRSFLLPLLALALVAFPVGTPRAQAQRFRAPELDGGVEFLGVDKPFHLKDLRGKIVLLDFWTLC